MIINRYVNFNNINEIKLFNHFFLNILNVNIDLFLFEMFLKWFISKLSLFDLFSIINLKDRIIITNNVFNKNDKFSNVDILLLLYSHYLNINNILFFNISNTTSYLFIYNFSKIKSCYFNEAIKIK